MAERTFNSGGRTYSWFGGFGAIFQSRERGVSVGDVRMVGDELFYAFMVTPQGVFRAPKVSWTQPKVSIEHIRSLQCRMFGLPSLPSSPETR